MKIGLFTDTYYPQINGVATSVLMLKENLAAVGHDVYVFTTTDPDAPEKEENVYRLPSVPFANVRRLGMFYHPRYAKMIKGLKLDLIHTHTEFSLGIFGRMMAKELKVPTVHTMHTIYEDYTHYIVKMSALDPIAKSAAKKLSKIFCNQSDAVIVPTEKVETLLRGYGVYKDISVIPTGIELGKFSGSGYDRKKINNLRAGFGIGPTDKALLYIGRISEEKNISEILHGLQQYLPANQDVKFILIGDGPDRQRLEALSRDLGISGQIIFAGARPWDEIGLYYQIGDVFVSASQSETQGLTYIEALAAGLPLVAKSDPCLDNVLVNGINGYSFFDRNSLWEALNYVFRDELEHRKMSTAAVQSAERFSAPYFAAAVAELYETVLGMNQAHTMAS